jgi:hypothetical protein
MSAAKLKGYDIDAILLRKGEEFIPIDVPTPSVSTQRHSTPMIRSLLGIAVDTSGSMQDSIRNRAGESVSRFEGVRSGLAEIGAQVRDELSRRSAEVDDSFRVFVYAFGLRIGSGVADMASLWAAARK